MTAKSPPGVSSRQHILNCSARLFKESGYAATSLRDIAEATGMRSASLYHHFASKDEIVIAVLNTAICTVLDEVKNSVATVKKDAYELRIRKSIEAHLRAIFELNDFNGAAIRIYDQLPPHITRDTFPEREEYLKYWDDLLKEAQAAKFLRKNIDRSLLRLFLFGAVNWTPQWYRPGRATTGQIAKAFCEFLLDGSKEYSKKASTSKVSKHSVE